MEENVTFSGKEPEKLFSMDELATIVKMLEGSKPEVAQITHNCTNMQLLEKFGHVAIGDAKDVYFGLPVYKRGWVPLNEVWLQNDKGEVIRKFSF